MADEQPQPNDRPRPQYGELAPPGWVWRPPADQHRLDTDRPLPDSAPAGPDYPPAHPGATGARPPVTGSTGNWNLTLTILLIVFGFFGMSYSVILFQAVVPSIQFLYTQNHLGSYSPPGYVGAIVTAGSIAMALIWIVSTAISVTLLARRRLAFYVPLIAGVLAFVLVIALTGLVAASDPTLMELYRQGTVPPTTP
ncbi:DUF6264 family protein [Leifsonia sp. AG29]|uniref:DUF6264 family protein n=1 Tax=Leifsonia sp. AG29 TaxID=2598860 RepID=UPI00131E1A52|nr:DUF6264 family protein [Leifsonia sp. AG29]